MIRGVVHNVIRPSIKPVGLGNRGSGAVAPLAVLEFDVVLVNEDGVDEQYAHITWTPSSAYETEIYRSLDGGAFALLTTVAPNIAEYDDQLMDGDEHEVEYYARHKEDLTVLNIPTGLTVALITGGFRLTWDDNNTDADFIEIWSDHLSDTYALIATVAAGTETYDHVFASLNINYKIRAKEGTLPVYSSFSDVVNKTDTRYLSKTVGDEYAYIADNGTLDILGTGNFTMTGWVKIADKNTYYLFGKCITGSVAGRYGIYSNVTTGYLSAFIQSSGGTITINSTVDGSVDWRYIRLDVNKTTSVIRFFIDEIQIGVDQSFTGTFGNPGNQYEFYIGTGNNGAGSGVEITSKGLYRDVRLFRKLLSIEESARVALKKAVTSPLAQYLCNAYPLVDSSGSSRDLTGTNLSSSNIVTP